MIIKYTGIYTSVLILCAGCIASGTVPQDHYYRLPEQKTILNPSAEPQVKTLGVGQISAEGLYRERALLFVDMKSPLELQRYYYRHWVKTPTQLLRDDIITFFKLANYAQNVIRFKPSKDVDVLIRGRIFRFEQLIEAQQIKVTVGIEFEINDYRNDVNRSWNKEYIATENVDGDSMHTSVQSFGIALEKIYNTLLEDLS